MTKNIIKTYALRHRESRRHVGAWRSLLERLLRLPTLRRDPRNDRLNVDVLRKTYKIITYSLSLIFLLISFKYLTGNVFGQNLSLSISPPLVEIMIKPGKTVTQAYKIRNDGEPVIVTISLMDYRPGDLKASPDFQPESWIQIINNDLSLNTPFLLNSNQEKQVILKISPPLSTPEEEYYRVVMFSTSPNPASQLSESGISQSLGSILLVSVTRIGEKLKAAQLTKSVIPAVMDSFDPLKLDFDLQNTGTIYVRPVGDINLAGQAGLPAQAGKANFKILPKIILPGHVQRLTTDNSKSDGQDLHTLYLPGFYLGKYEVSISFTLDDSKIKIEHSKTFYALPWKTFLVLIILLLVFFQYFKIKKEKNA